MQLNSFLHSLLAAYACGVSGNYHSARQDYSQYRRAARDA